MKNAFPLASLILFFSNKASAQGKIPEFGKIDIAELNLKECAFEKTAGALILAKTARIEFEINGFTNVPILTIEYAVRIKIFNKRGYPAASIKIPYVSNSRSTKIKDVEGYIYSLDPNGKIVKEKVEKKEIFNERSKDKKSLNYLAFTFPDLKDGSVIECHHGGPRVCENVLSCPGVGFPGNGLFLRQVFRRSIYKGYSGDRRIYRFG